MSNDIAYITRFNPVIFPRPLFMKKAIPELNIYLLSLRGVNTKSLRRQLAGTEESGRLRQMSIARQLINIVKRKDPLKVLEPCYRQDRSYDALSLFEEAIYDALFFRRLREKYIIIKNAIGALAAINSGKEVIIDLMDLWHCDKDFVILNSIDSYVFKKVKCIIAWSKAITALLRRLLPGQCVEYLPFGIDLDLMDPLKVSPKLLLEKYPNLDGKVIIGYSGGGEGIMALIN